jgi:hypothetical protein
MAPAASLRFLRFYFDDVDLVSVRISHGQTPILTGLQFPIDILEERASELRRLTPGRGIVWQFLSHLIRGCRKTSNIKMLRRHR